MGMKTIRSTISLDAQKEQDIINALQVLADSHKQGDYIVSLIRADFDNNGAILRNMTAYHPLAPNRTEFFKQIKSDVKEMDRKIKAIYDMCLELHGLARMNKAIELESKADNLMMSVFVLQRQQSKIKEILGEGEFPHVYDSERLLNEKDKADSIMEYIMETYGGLIAEVKPLLFKEIEIPISSVVMQTTPIQTVAVPQEPPAAKPEPSNEEEYIDLPEKPPVQSKKDISTLETPTGEAADFLLSMMEGE